MFQSTIPDAVASTVQPAVPSAVQPTEPPKPETVRHLLFGSPNAVQATIKLLHRLNYAEPNDWSQPISTGRSHEVMAILTKKVNVG